MKITESETDNLLLAESLKETRRKLGLTQKEFAALLDVNDKVYGRWETGLSKPGHPALVKLALESLNRLPANRFQPKPVRKELSFDERVRYLRHEIAEIEALASRSSKKI